MQLDYPDRSTRLPACILAVAVVLAGCVAGLDADSGGASDRTTPDLPGPSEGSTSGGFATIVAVSWHRPEASEMHVEFTAEIPEPPDNLTFATDAMTTYRCDRPTDQTRTAFTMRFRDAQDWPVVVRNGPVDISRRRTVDPPPAVDAVVHRGWPSRFHWETVPVDDEYFSKFEGKGPLIQHSVFMLGSGAAPGMEWTLNWTGTDVKVESWQDRTFAYDQAGFAGPEQLQIGPAGWTGGGRMTVDFNEPGDRPDDWMWLGLAPRELGGTEDTSEPGTLRYRRPNGSEGEVETGFEQMWVETSTGAWDFQIEESAEPTGRTPIVYGASWPRVSLCDEPGYRSS